ncbi:glycosyltransferase [bacterium]|nr:glycosyltransferase [bacterium]
MKDQELRLLVTIDTECDKSASWRTASPLSFRAVTDAIPNLLQPLFAEFGIRPTYLLSPEILLNPDCVDVLRSLRDVELTTHLHGDYVAPRPKTWDFAGTLTDEMQWEYGPEIEHAKLATLTELFRQQFGYQPLSFRAGRFGASSHTCRILRELGYLIDSSVTPHICWTSRRGAKQPDYRSFSEFPYRVGPDGNIALPGKSQFVELPVTILPAGTVSSAPAGEPVWFRPWYSNADTLCEIVRQVSAQPARDGHRRPLVMMFHNVELVAGASPYPQSKTDVSRFTDMLKQVFAFARRVGAQPCTMAEYHSHFLNEVSPPAQTKKCTEQSMVPSLRSQTLNPELRISRELVESVLDRHGVPGWFHYIFRERGSRWDTWKPCVWAAEHLSTETPVLSLGCGVGFNLFWLAEHGFTELYGCDIDPRTVAAGTEIATKTGFPIQFWQDDGLSPHHLPEMAFGLIEALNWTHLIEGFSLDDFLDRYLPHLEVGGIIVLDVIDAAYNDFPDNQYCTQDRSKPVAEKRPSEYRVRHSRAEIEQIFSRSGLTIESIFQETQEIPKIVYVARRSGAVNTASQQAASVVPGTPPQKIPATMTEAYTMSGRARVEEWYLNEATPPEQPLRYPRTLVEDLRQRISRREAGSYGPTNLWLYQALDRFSIRGKDVVVIGSELPWYEALILENGGRCTTVEYRRIVTDHPGITTLTPSEFEAAPRLFDVAFSISSFEHDGLGRYGDPLNPDGDVAAMQKVRSMLRPGGILFLAVPVGSDVVVWNAHRIYGRHRLPKLLAGWRLLAAYGFDESLFDHDTVGAGPDRNYVQPIFVLENCPSANCQPMTPSFSTSRLRADETQIQRSFSPPGRKPRILLIADVPNWIFERHCKVLKLLLADEFEFSIAYQGQSIYEDNFDLIYPLEWNLIPDEAIRTPAKWVTGIRSHLSWKDEDFLLFAERLKTRFQRVHVVSKRLAELFAPFVPTTLHLTHGVDLERFRPRTRSAVSPTGKLRLGWAGNRKSPGKGFEQFIAPLSKLPGVELVFCGYSDRNLAVDQMREFYDSIDAYICASDFEGNNNSVMEAAAMERAIITTDCGAVPEYLKHRESALIVSRQLPAFMQAVIELRDEPALRVALGRNARAAVTQFDWRCMAEEHRRFFRESIAVSRNGIAASEKYNSQSPKQTQPIAPQNPTTQESPSNLESVIREALSINPNGVDALRLLAALHIQRQQWLDGAKVCYRVLELNANDVETLLLLAKCLLGGGEGETAIEVFRKILQLDPQNQLARECLNDLTGQDENDPLAKAERNAREVLRLEPHNEDAQRLLGVILMEQSRWEDALKHCQSILTRQPKDTATRAQVAFCYWKLGTTTTAELLFDEVANADSENTLLQQWRQESKSPVPAAQPVPVTPPLQVRPAQPTTESVGCPFCASRRADRVRHAADIVQCSDCQTVYLRTRMTTEQMEKLYQTYADDGSHMALPKSKDAAAASCLKRDYFFQEILGINQKRGRILDIGCGWGAFLLNARDHGFQPAGMELTRKAVHYANDELQIPVVNTQFLDTPYEENSHQVITMLHVLEHLPQPREAIAKVFLTLQPGGLFCGIVPNFASYCSRHAGDRWYWLDPNYHYVHYTPETLRRHLEAAGFVVERIYTALGDYGMRMHREVADRVDASLRNDASHQQLVDQLAQNGQGEEIRFFARKPEQVASVNALSSPNDLQLSDQLTHLLDLREPLSAEAVREAGVALEAALDCASKSEFARAHKARLDRIFFGLIDLQIGKTTRNGDHEFAGRLKILRGKLIEHSDLKPRVRESGWSFCFITNGKRPEKLRRAIESVQSLNIPNCEILIGGEASEGFDDIEFVPAVDAARNGRLGEMRNRLLDRARFDHLVVADDDLIFQSDFFRGLQQFGDDFEVLCVRLLNPDGTRYWDWATNAGPRGHKLLPYDETDPHVYVTGGLCVMKAAVGDRVRWSDSLGFYQGEDADFSRRLHAAGISIRFNSHSTVIHGDPRYTSIDGVILDPPAVRQMTRESLCRHETEKAREYQKLLLGMDSATPTNWNAFVDSILTGEKDGRYLELVKELFPVVTKELQNGNHFAKLAEMLAGYLERIGPFYFHCGGAGDGLLLLSTFYDRHPESVIVSMANSNEAMKSFFDAFPKLKNVYFLPEHPDPHHHLLVRMLMKLVRTCRGVGVTPYQEYSEWNPTFDIYRQRKVTEHPKWAREFQRTDSPACVTLSPKGSLTGMVGSKRNQLDPATWPALQRLILDAGLTPVILGTPDEATLYPAISGAVDQRSYSFREQMEWIASSKVFVGADSWGKTFAALRGIPTIVFDSLRGADWTGKKDASDFVFIDPWSDITLVRSFDEFRKTFQKAIAKQPAPSQNAQPAVKQTTRFEINWHGSFLDYGSLSNINRVLTDTLVIQNGASIRRIQTTPVTGKLAKPLQSYRGKLASKANTNASLTVRHAWPPDWSRPAQGKLAVIQPWEFGSLPKDWVNASANADVFWVPSNYVRQVYIESGVPAEKVHVVPNGIDPKAFHPQVKPLSLATKKKFKFLFVGGTIHRKGPDVLLKAYCETFTAKDDVCLVIKDFGGASVYAGQTIDQQIREIQKQPNTPEILYLTNELPARDLPGLYKACNCLVHPYRGEGFGLPVLEAMACGLPVIVTAGGATDDFVPAEIGYRIPSTRQVFGREISGMPLAGDGWLLEPNVDALKKLIRHVVEHREEARARGNAASAHVRENWTWNHTANRIAELVQQRAADVPSAEETPKPSEQKSHKPIAIKLPAVAKLGHLGAARELFKQGKLVAAWNANLDAIAQRPFHPEACLLLAEIACQSGDATRMKECVDRALSLTPNWKTARKFAKTHKLRPAKTKTEFSPLPPTREPQLSVCLITKNEEKFLDQCLRSIKDIAQQIVVMDTGSTDRTVDIAKQHGAEVHSVTWCDDFSAARNAALEKATGDWVLVLDADEELAPDSKAALRIAMQTPNTIGWRLPIIDVGHEAEGRTFVARLFRNAPGLFYVSRVHEQVFSSVEVRREEWNMETAVADVKLIHHGYTAEVVKDRNKVIRNLRLLEMTIDEIPGDPNLLMNYGLELIRSERFDEGLKRYAEAFAALDGKPVNEVTPELRESLLTQYTSHLMKVNRWSDIVAVLSSRVARAGKLTASLQFTLGLAHQELHQWTEAVAAFRACIATRNEPSFYLVNQVIHSGAPRHCLALALWQSGAIEDATGEFASAIQEDPKLAPLRMDAARFATKHGDPVEALKLFHGLVTENTQFVEAWVHGARVALSQPDFIEFARDWTAEAIKHHPTNRDLIAARGETLLLTQQYADALPFWRQLNGQPRALSARLFCELMQGEFSIDGPPENEAETSQEFLNWYRRLVNYGAAEGVQAVGERLEYLATVLPSAARTLNRVLEQAAVEAA